MNRWLIAAICIVWLAVTGIATAVAVVGSTSPTQDGIQFLYLGLLGVPWSLFIPPIGDPGSISTYFELIAYSVINLCLILLIGQGIAAATRNMSRKN